MLLILIIIKTPKYFSFLLIAVISKCQLALVYFLKVVFMIMRRTLTDTKLGWAVNVAYGEDETSNATSMVMMSLALETVGLKVGFVPLWQVKGLRFPWRFVLGKQCWEHKWSCYLPLPLHVLQRVPDFTELLSHWHYLLLYIFCSTRGQFKATLLYFNLPASWLLH